MDIRNTITLLNTLYGHQEAICPCSPTTCLLLHSLFAATSLYWRETLAAGTAFQTSSIVPLGVLSPVLGSWFRQSGKNTRSTALCNLLAARRHLPPHSPRPEWRVRRYITCISIEQELHVNWISCALPNVMLHMECACNIYMECACNILSFQPCWDYKTASALCCDGPVVHNRMRGKDSVEPPILT